MPGICYLKNQTEFFIIDHTLCESLYNKIKVMHQSAHMECLAPVFFVRKEGICMHKELRGIKSSAQQSIHQQSVRIVLN